jgi:hypothetical protein
MTALITRITRARGDIIRAGNEHHVLVVADDEDRRFIHWHDSPPC